MSNKFKIFTDSSSDLIKDMREKYDIEYFSMGIVVGGKDYHVDLDFEEYSQE